MQKKRNFEETIRAIQDIKIQGANNIALEGIKLALDYPEKKSIAQISQARPTEPLLQNALRILKKSKDKRLAGKKLVKYIENSKKEIAMNGAELIKKDMNIFSHCHSSSVIEILKYAKKKQKKNFIVYTLEVEPLLQGRQTAKDLAEAGIKVVVFPDLAADEAIKNCDLFLFGADAFLPKGVINKIGTKILCDLAKHHKIPRYSCGVELKYTKKIKIEKRNGKEVWDQKNKNISVINPAFDFTQKNLLTGVVSESGVHSYKTFLKEAKKVFKTLKKN